jgi:hypothetical protein
MTTNYNTIYEVCNLLYRLHIRKSVAYNSGPKLKFLFTGASVASEDDAAHVSSECSLVPCSV